MLRGRFQKFLIILSGKSVLCGHFQIFLLKFLKTDFLNFEQEHDSDTECFLMIMTCFNQDLAGGSGHSSYLSHTPPTAYF